MVTDHQPACPPHRPTKTNLGTNQMVDVGAYSNQMAPPSIYNPKKANVVADVLSRMSEKGEAEDSTDDLCSSQQ